MTARIYYRDISDEKWDWKKEREFQERLEEMATKVANVQEIIELSDT